MKDLDSYLNDHLAGSVGALEMIAHCAQLYKGKRLGAFFTYLEMQIAADQDVLRDLMTRLCIEESKVRRAFWKTVVQMVRNGHDGSVGVMNTYGLNPGTASPQQHSSQSLASAAIVSLTGLTEDNTHLCSQVWPNFYIGLHLTCHFGESL